MNEAKLRDIWGQWLQEWSWEWFVTLTFRYELRIDAAENRWKKWIQCINKAINDQVGYFRVMEWHRSRKVPHFHALMLNLKGARRLDWMDEWNYLAGYARIWPYKKEKGASYYLSKYVVKNLVDYQFGGCILKV